MTEETIKEILKFRDDRDWKQFHNPKDLAISIRWRQQSYWKYPSGAVRISQMKENRKDKRRTGGCW